MEKNMAFEVDINPGRVANLLKSTLNSFCKENEEWYDDVGEMPTVFDMYRAIEILEEVEPETFTVLQE